MAITYISTILSTFLLASSFAKGFVPYAVTKARYIAVLGQDTSKSRLHAVADPPSVPADDKEKEKREELSTDDDIDSDWMLTEKGFVSNVTKHKVAPSERVLVVDNIQDYKTEVVDEKERLVVVRFYASWCRSCKASEPQLKKLIHKLSPHLKFVEVPLTRETAYLQEGLGKFICRFSIANTFKTKQVL